MTQAAIDPDMIEHSRVVVRVDKHHPGSKPEGSEANGMIEVVVDVRVLPWGENELIAHYLINQAVREALAKVDKIGLDRVNPR